MPRPHPKEFRDDVVAVARRGEAPIAPTVGPRTDGSHQTGGFDGRWKEAGDAPAGVIPGCHALAARPKASRDGVEVVAMDCFTGFNRHR